MSDFVYTDAKGVSTSGIVAGYKAVRESYAPFSEHYHEPIGPISCWETEKGYFMMGQATMFANLPVPGEAKAKADANGKNWDLALPDMTFGFPTKLVVGQVC